MLQGDSYEIPIEILKDDNEIATDADFADVEVVIGIFTKTLSKGEIRYDNEQKAFMFPLEQSRTFKLNATKQPVQVRVKTHSGDVIGCNVGEIDVIKSLSKAVL